MNNARRQKVLAAAIENLYQYFDTVQIFVTKHTGGTGDETQSFSSGCGNVYARIAQTRLWAQEQEEFLLSNGGDENPEDPEDPEDPEEPEL